MARIKGLNVNQIKDIVNGNPVRRGASKGLVNRTYTESNNNFKCRYPKKRVVVNKAGKVKIYTKSEIKAINAVIKTAG